MSAQKSNKHRKYGRNRDKCQRYRANGTREKNKERKAKKLAAWVEKRREKNATKRVISV